MNRVATRPRLGFLGVGWIGRQRLDAVRASGVADVAAIADPALENAQASLDDLLAADVDAVVIATPSALHAEQAIAALEHGVAVFCQKPLGRTATEAASVVAAARSANRLLGVDHSYRWLEALMRLRTHVRDDVHTVDLTFHNGYGPDKAWFYDPELSGGGCVIDLGTHLIDMLYTLFGRRAVEHVDSSLHGRDGVEEYAHAQLELEGGLAVRLACSWGLPLGDDAEIAVHAYADGFGLHLENVAGSFYDFRSFVVRGRGVETLAEPPDEWGGRAIVAWATQLAASAAFDPDVEQVVDVARVIDAIYGNAR